MKSLTPKEIKTELDNVHSTSAPAFVIVFKWVNEFKRGRTYVMHLVRDVQLRLLRQNIDKVHDIVLIDWWVRKCANLLKLQAYHIRQWFQFCTNNWVWKSYRQNGRRVCSLWIFARSCDDFKTMFQRNPDKFLRRFITLNETWIHCFILETKEQSKQWTSWISSEEGKNRKINRKDDDHRDACGIHIDYLPSKQTINGDYYAALLNRFNNILKKKYPHLAKKKVLFHQDMCSYVPDTDGQIQWIATNCFSIQHIRQI